jgi:heptosyltransferase I
LARLSGAQRRIGFGKPGGREFSRWFNNERVDPKATHMIDRYLELLGPLGIASPTVRFEVPESPGDRQAAESAIRQAGFERGFALINAGAGWPSKLWPADRFAAVAAHLGAAWNLPTMVVAPASWAKPTEAGRAERIVAASQDSARLAPALSLSGLGALARRAKLFIGSDTGPLHLASAVGTPCIGLYGPWPGNVHGPYGPQHVILQKMHFNGPTRARRTAPAIYMESITTAMACEACDRILASVQEQHRRTE